MLMGSNAADGHHGRRVDYMFSWVITYWKDGGLWRKNACMPNRRIVLLAEDDEDHVHLIRRAFEQAPIQDPLFVVSDGDEAVQYLQGVGRYSKREEFPLPALMLLDLNMPRRNGFEVLEWIRAHPTLRALRVVVLATSSDLRDVNRAYQLGANSFLVKPGDFTQVISLVKAMQSYWLETVRCPESERAGQPASARTQP